ncbi:unnamed protein product [Prorocentrum cordatum]|uniref:Uncharacterized protein n=1 Tax=Prorocentrum cordatum TaxID=2364126 RepID=A0ABN9U909_9DINO|nr:unnamed protein product [Polarella glacialis]
MINHQKRQPPTSSCPKPVTGRDLSEGAEKQRKAEREGSGEGARRDKVRAQGEGRAAEATKAKGHSRVPPKVDARASKGPRRARSRG